MQFNLNRSGGTNLEAISSGLHIYFRNYLCHGLTKFGEALAKFKTDARKGTNEQLKTSYSAVHDSFEMLAAMLPRG